MEQYLVIKVSLPDFRRILREEVRSVFSETGIMKVIGLYENLLTVEDVSAILKVKKKAVYNLIAQGKIRSTKKGKRYYIQRSDLTAYLTEVIIEVPNQLNISENAATIITDRHGK